MTGGSCEGNRSKPHLGIAQWFHIGDRRTVAAVCDGMQRGGVTHLRTGVSWADYHRKDGREWYDWLIPMLGERFTLLPCVTYTPPSLGRYAASAAPPRRPKDYADFLDMLVASHGIWFDAVELWNEPNNLLDWDWRIDPDWQIFSEMVGGAAYWMKRCGKRTVLGGMCPTDLNWLDLMGQRGVLSQIDVVGVHAFPDTWTAHFGGWSKEIDAVRTHVRRWTADADVWITECGYATWRCDEPTQAGHLVDMLDAPVERAYWYTWSDLDPRRETQAGFHVDERHYHTGLVTFDGHEKLSARSLAGGGIDKLRSTVSIARRSSPLPRGDRPIVITGGCGFLGCNIADRFARDGRDVVVVDNLSRPAAEVNGRWLLDRHPRRVGLAAIDLRDRLALAPVVRNAAAILHLGAQVAVTTSLVRPGMDFDVNAAGTVNLLEAVRTTNPDAPLLFASTNKVYGALADSVEFERRRVGWWPSDPGDPNGGSGLAQHGVNETAPLDFHSPYGCSKGAADQYVRDYARVFGLRTAVMRMSCIYGPRQVGDEDQGWIGHFLRSAIERRSVTIYGDGHQVRDALHVDDAVAAWLAVLDAMPELAGSVFNLGGGPRSALSLEGLIAKISSRHGRNLHVLYAPARPGDQRWYVSDTRALQQATGWRPTIDLDTGLDHTARWLEDRFAPHIAPAVPALVLGGAR